MKKGLIAALLVAACFCLATQAGAAEKFFIDPVTYAVTVNYDLSIAELARASGYHLRISEIDDKIFPVVGTGIKKFKFVLVCSRESVTTKEVLKYMDRHQLQPADIKQLLSFGKKYKKQYELTITGFGSRSMGSDGARYVACLSTAWGVRELGLCWDSQWIGGCRFLAVSQ